ncbi:MAG: T9SS type A sorting domain-containing protein [Flavobacteriales bacterium]|jgi:hypothetical protein|nr:T9SS type A sorting domain-containing protein [Flavobacteriales bacterium]
MPVHRSLLLLAACAVSSAALAQPAVYFDGSVPVQREGASLRMPWAGGLNFVHASEMDFDGDGHDDLLLFDRSANVTMVLLNDGIPDQASYTHTRAYDQLQPLDSIQTWVLLRDYNCDGLMDIFVGGHSQGVAVYRNVGSLGAPDFELVTPQIWYDWVFANGGTQLVNMYAANIDMPGIMDVDGDGDLDILTFGIASTTLSYYKNMSMELYGTCDSLTFRQGNHCWGFFAEDVSDNTVTLDVPCPYNVPDPEIGPGGDLPQEAGGDRAHAGSTVTPLDLNGDGLLDLLVGDFSFNNMVALYNGGTPDLAFMTVEETYFPVADVPVDLPVFPGACHIDLDNDGRRDLLVSPHSTSQAEGGRSMWYYRNTGTDEAPVFNLDRQDLFQSEMIDFGEGAHPVFFDHDGDGLMDIVVGNHGYFDPVTLYTSHLALLRNVGTATEPAFDLVNIDYMGLSDDGLGEGIYPAFGDLDGDGDLDMYVGHLDGRIHYYANVAQGPVAQFQLMQPNITHSTGEVIDVGQNSTPQLFDLDGDGLLDLIIGEHNGNINHYRNTGTAALPQWTFVTDSLGGVDTRPMPGMAGYSVPHFHRDADGVTTLLVGTRAGWVRAYTGIDGNLDGDFTLLDDRYTGVRDGDRSSPALYDLTGDGQPEMVLGNVRGGLSFWRGGTNLGTDDLARRPGGFSLFPNPAAGHVVVELDAAPAPGAVWALYDAMGRAVRHMRPQGGRTVFPLDGIAPGTYLMRLEGDGAPRTQRMVVMPAGGAR